LLHLRLISGSIAVALLVALLWLDEHASRPGIYLAPLVILLGILATRELIDMLRAYGAAPRAKVLYVGTLLPILASLAPLAWQEYPADCPMGRLGWLACGLVAGLLLVLVSVLFSLYPNDQPHGTPFAELGQASLSILYIGGLLGFLVQLRLLVLPDVGRSSLIPLVTTILVVKFSDTCQYFVGKKFGSRKLAPALSPGKTWEGTIGGIGLGVLLMASVLVSYSESLTGPVGWLRFAVYSLVICMAGLLGDLAESMLKRDAGIKDSSSWLPGLGGMLDILDSLLLAGPVSYACWVIHLVGT